MRIGILPLGRPTFDVAFANERLAAMLARLDATANTVVGPRQLLFDADATRTAIGELQGAGIDRLLLLQVTFTDASMTVTAAAELDVPLAIWAVPEPRTGGRLRLNAFCGLNLASHALGRNGRRPAWLYADPEEVAADDLAKLLADEASAPVPEARRIPAPSEPGRGISARIAGKRIGRLGEHPVGFDTCAYSPDAVRKLSGVTVDALDLEELFLSAGRAGQAELAAARAEAETVLAGLDAVDQGQLERSLKLRAGLAALRSKGGYDAFAIRCWPETFTEYGGAVCGPVSMMGEARVPCACEADVYGALTQLVLQEAAGAPAFLTDVVDIDARDDTVVVWHCGQAPASMRDPDVSAVATVHSNRKMPLLFEFPLKPGEVTVMRISQARGQTQIVLGRATMLRRPLAFSGTAGVMRFARPAAEVRATIIDAGLEHHVALAYGDHVATLQSVAAALDLPVLEL